MKVVADSHSIYWYLTDPGRLSDKALIALGDAEDGEGIVVSAVTMPDLWMAVSRKRGERAIPRSGYELLRSLLDDPDTNVSVEPVGPAVWRHFESLPLTIGDPMDCLITATALALGVPLVTTDGKITKACVVDVIW